MHNRKLSTCSLENCVKYCLWSCSWTGKMPLSYISIIRSVFSNFPPKINFFAIREDMILYNKFCLNIVEFCILLPIYKYHQITSKLKLQWHFSELKHCFPGYCHYLFKVFKALPKHMQRNLAHNILFFLFFTVFCFP